MKNQKLYRQGDVLIIAVAKKDMPAALKPGTREKGRIILAHGEATGHAHAISDPEVDVLVGNDGRVFLRVPAGTEVRHEEHSPVALPAGNFEVRRQREYSPEAIRNVAD